MCVELVSEIENGVFDVIHEPFLQRHRHVNLRHGIAILVLLIFVEPPLVFLTLFVNRC